MIDPAAAKCDTLLDSAKSFDLPAADKCDTLLHSALDVYKLMLTKGGQSL